MRIGGALAYSCMGVLFVCACAYCVYWLGAVL